MHKLRAFSHFHRCVSWVMRILQRNHVILRIPRGIQKPDRVKDYRKCYALREQRAVARGGCLIHTIFSEIICNRNEIFFLAKKIQLSQKTKYPWRSWTDGRWCWIKVEKQSIQIILSKKISLRENVIFAKWFLMVLLCLWWLNQHRP